MANCSRSDPWSPSWLDCDNDVPLSQSLVTCWPLLLISWGPFIILLLSLIHILILVWRGRNVKPCPPSLLLIFRLLVTLLLVVSYSLLIHWSRSSVLLLSDGVVLGLLFLLALLILLQTWIAGQITLFYFWISFLVARVTFLISPASTVVQGLYVTITILAVIGLILECFVPGSGSLKDNPSPEETCSHASLIFFTWLEPLFLLGTKRNLGGGDIPHLQKSFSVKAVLDKFTRTKNKATGHSVDEAADNVVFGDVIHNKQGDNRTETSKRSIDIVSLLARNFSVTFLTAALMKFIQDLLKFVVPKVLGALITFIDKGDTNCGPWWEGYVLAVGIFLIGNLQTILLQQYWKKTHRVALRTRTILFSEIYRKSLVVSPAARKDFTVGEIVSLMSSDAQTFKQIIPSLNMVWSMPLQIILSIYFLYQEIGATVFAGVVVLVFLIPFNTGMGKLSQKYKSQQLSFKDKRIRKMYELLSSFKIVKLYAWELMFKDRVGEERQKEVLFLKKNAVVKAMINFVFGSAPIIVTLVSFGAYVSIDPVNNVLTPEKAFVCLTLFNMLKLPLNLLPNILTSIFTLRVSAKRVNKFLNCEEVLDYVGKLGPSTNVDIQLKDASFAWGDGQTNLHNINMDVSKGQLALVTGPTGSGKSSLLSAILGQMSLEKGSVSLSAGRNLAYVPQEAWLQNLTIRENIIFGKEFNDKFYRQVIQACALEDDLLILQEGDQTVIGEQGVNMSGGQKQRISLARAVYSCADIVILDDPLSAVDVHVAQHLMKCVLGPGGILSDKTRLLVTHNLGLVSKADMVLSMEQGTLSVMAGHKINQLDNRFNGDSEREDGKEKDVSEEKEVVGNGNCCNGVLDDKLADKLNNGGKEKMEIVADKKDMTARLQDKSVATGSAFVRAYSLIIRNLGVLNFIFVLILYVFNQSLTTGSSVWLTHWSDQTKDLNATEEFDNRPYIGVYGAIGLGTAICAFLRNLMLFWVAAKGSEKIHSRMFGSLIKAKLGFMQSTSSGSLVSRFSGDLDTVDNMIPNMISAFLYNSFDVLGVLVTISISSPIFLAAAIPVLLIFYGIKLFYVRTSRQLKRLESSSNSPIYRHFSETISGLPSVKGYGQTSRFLSTLESLSDKNLTYSYYSTMCGRWLSLRTEMVAQLLVLAAALLAVGNRDNFSSGWAGLIVTLALSITETFNWLLSGLTSLEDQATVVERIKELVKHTPQEPDWSSPTPPGVDWPKHGQLELENYSTGYEGVEDLVLNNINISFQPGEKVAIVGRTGAGKSSLALALLRVLEARQGRILIDGLDISKLGLHELRSSVTIIPQDPVLFAGTLRQNVDPEEKHSDQVVKETLVAARLSPEENGEVGGRLVEQGGANFSQGERQLVCLARAICRRSRLIIMDEATASVDEETDQMVQKTMRDQFKDSTVVTIAHRLNTIMDYDRVVVLDSGKVVEQGNPAQMVREEKGIFYMMVKEM